MNTKQTGPAKLLAEKYGMQFVDLNNPDSIDPDATEHFRINVARQHWALPIKTSGFSDEIVVAILDPTNIEMMDVVRCLLSRFRVVTFCIADYEAMALAFRKHYSDRLIRT